MQYCNVWWPVDKDISRHPLGKSQLMLCLLHALNVKEQQISGYSNICINKVFTAAYKLFIESLFKSLSLFLVWLFLYS